MKRFIICLAVFASNLAYSQSDNLSLVGEWEGFEGTGRLTFIFESDSVITMLNSKDPGTILGGRESIRNEKKVRMIYLLDKSQKPFAIDFVIQETNSKIELGRMKGILEFEGENKLKINFRPGKERPTSFENDFITITRKM